MIIERIKLLRKKFIIYHFYIMNRIEQIKAEEREKIRKRAEQAALRVKYGHKVMQNMKKRVPLLKAKKLGNDELSDTYL